MQELRIRRADPSEARLLTELTVRSKASWGYDPQFMTEARAELEFHPERFPGFHVYVLELKQAVIGFFALRPHHGDKTALELTDLFIEPSHIGRGYGRLLWNQAAKIARELGYMAMLLTSDPNAEPFYRRCGAVTVGMKESSVRGGRMLPLMRYDLSGPLEG